MIKISSLMKNHYEKTFAAHGQSSQGVDWGPDPADHLLRLERMLAVTDIGTSKKVRTSLLDVGCGYGSLLDLIKERKLDIDYHGVDLCESMINSASNKNPNIFFLLVIFLI